MNAGPTRVFLLSPASCRGKRASLLFSPRSAFPLADAVRRGGAPLGQVFSFLSGLYFRGKLEYARAFARPPRGAPGVLIVTPSEGLRPPEYPVCLDRLRAFAAHDIDPANPLYTEPFRRDAAALRARDPDAEIVLLGSIATPKYALVLSEVFGGKLRFPGAFVGRGDMSRGGLLLRHARSGVELEYRGLEAGPRTGSRPPRLARAEPGGGKEKRARALMRRARRDGTLPPGSA